MDFLEALARASSYRPDENDRSDRRTPPEVLCITLKETAARYAQPCPFKEGDLVTPRKGSPIKGAGQPHWVIAVNLDAAPIFAGNPGSQSFGMRPNIRVLSETEGCIVAHWAEAANFEPYTGPVASLDDEAA